MKLFQTIKNLAELSQVKLRRCSKISIHRVKTLIRGGIDSKVEQLSVSPIKFKILSVIGDKKYWNDNANPRLHERVSLNYQP